MKIKFVKGTREEGGVRAIFEPGLKLWVAGCFYVGHNNSWWRTGKKAQKDKISIMVVKQKGVFNTIGTLIHELTHAFVHTFISKKRNNKYHRWIDRNN